MSYNYCTKTTAIRCLLLLMFMQTGFFIPLFSQTNIPAGDISGTWLKSGSPYRVQGEVTIPSGQTLYIEPGVTVEFQGHYKFNVQGTLLAVGNQSDSIRFTSRDGSTFWHGIRFDFTPELNDTSKIFFCVIENCNAYSGYIGQIWLDDKGGGIFIHGISKLIVSNSTIKNCSAANGGGIYCDYSKATIINTKIIQNKATYWGGGITVQESEINLIGCLIAHNTSEEYGGLMIHTNGLILNNTISGNKSLNPNSNAVQIAGNVDVANSIVYYNSPSGIMINQLQPADFYNCNIENGIKSFGLNYLPYKGKYIDNISDPPDFTDTASMNYSLQVSPCINSGSNGLLPSNYQFDLNGNSRIYQAEKVDLGAFEFQGTTPNRPPYIDPGKPRNLLKNVKNTFATFYHDADSDNDLSFLVSAENSHISLQYFITDSAIITEIEPELNWEGDFYITFQINDNAGEENSVYKDSVLVHMGDLFGGIIDFSMIFRDTVKVTDDLIILKSGNLSLQPGTYIEFQKGSRIIVFGKFNIYGNSDDTVVINTINDTVYFPVELGWGGIDVYKDDSDTMQFNYCTFMNTGMNNYYSERICNGTLNFYKVNQVNFDHCKFESNYSDAWDKGGITAHDVQNIIMRNCSFQAGSANYNMATYLKAIQTNILIDSCRFFNTSYINRDFNNSIIIIDSSDLQILNSEFYDCNAENLIKLSHCNLTLRNCNFNRLTGGNNLISLSNCTTSVENTVFLGNDGACMSILNSGQPMLRNNIFSGNKYHSIIASSSSPYIINNLFAYNQGAALHTLEYCFPVVANNTIVNNVAYNSNIVSMTYGNSTFVNNIIVDNQPPGIVFNYSAELDPPKVKGNIFDPGFVYDPQYNRDSIPRFRLNDTMDFTLTKKSFAINTALPDTSGLFLPALDLAGNFRIDTNYHKLDRGAYEYQGNDVHDPVIIKNQGYQTLLLTIYPNPSSDYIYFESDEVNDLKYHIADISGKLMQSGTISNNMIDIKELKSGIYFLKILQANMSFRIVKL